MKDYEKQMKGYDLIIKGCLFVTITLTVTSIWIQLVF